MRRRGTGLWAGVVLAALAACEAGYDPPEEAEPFDTIAPAPQLEPVPGMDEPGPDENP